MARSAKKKGGSKKTSKARKDAAPILDEEQRNEILAVAILALALFFALALVPVSVFGGRADDWFPSGNIIGVVGGGVQGLLYAFVGVSALFVPVFAGAWGLRIGGWFNPIASLRVAFLAAGLRAQPAPPGGSSS